MGLMQRTHVYLEPEMSQALDRLARQRGVSKAHLLRLAAMRFLEQEQEEIDAGDPIWGLIAMGNSGPGKVSVDHDRVLTEQNRKSKAP